MKFADTLRGLRRRWYIVIPGILLAAAITIGAWTMISPGYNRSATQLLLPGSTSIPDGANPYLFLGGLSPAADVLVRALGSQNVLDDVIDGRPGVEVEITRDTTTAGPIILISVTANTDAAAEEVLGLLVDRTATVLNEFQQVERIPEDNRVSVIPITVDNKSVLQQRTRLVAAAGGGIIGIMLTLLLAGVVDGMSKKRIRRRPSQGGDEAEAEAEAEAER